MSKAPKYQGPNAELYEQHEAAIMEVVAKFKATLDDGFQLKDLAEWAGLASECYDVAKTIYGDGFDRAEVTDIAVYVYWRIDPNIPLVTGFVEDMIERKFIEELAIPFAVNSAWQAVENYIESKKE